MKKKPAISVDGADAAIEDTVVLPAEIPTGFYTFGYFAMKYLVVKAYKGYYKMIGITLHNFVWT
jgi:hypothetical protein